MYLVTGGTGLIGSHLILKLLQSGHTVRATYRTEKTQLKVKKVFAYYSDDAEKLFESIDWVKADINDIVALEDAFDGITHVYHSAALISFDPGLYRKLKKVNVEGTKNIVNLCLKHEIKKLCYVSSIAALGASSTNERINEETDSNDKYATVYSITKKNAELQVWRAAQEGLPVVMVNPGVVLGPGFWKSGSGTFFYYAAKGNKYTMPGGTGFISINDVVNCMIQLMDSPIKSERFILVDENATYLNIIQRIAISMGVSPPKKVLTKTKIEVFWRLDWLLSKLFNKRRRLAKNMAKSLFKTEYYDTSKIEKALNVDFKGVEKAIEFSSARFKEAYPNFF